MAGPLLDVHSLGLTRMQSDIFFRKYEVLFFHFYFLNQFTVMSPTLLLSHLVDNFHLEGTMSQFLFRLWFSFYVKKKETFGYFSEVNFQDFTK